MILSSSYTINPHPPPPPSYLGVPIARRAWYASIGHWDFPYSARVECKYTSMPNLNPLQMFRFIHVSITVVPVTNRTHLVRRRRIISPMPTVQNPGSS